MDTPDHPNDALIFTAAMMRVEGRSWQTIGAEVNRHAETVRRWPERYPEQWRRAFRRAETLQIAEAAIEGRTVLRVVLRDKRTRYRIAAATQLTNSNDRNRTREEPNEPAEPECPRCRHVAEMSDDDIDRKIDAHRRHHDERYDDGAGI